MEPWAALDDALSLQPEAVWEELVGRFGAGLKTRVGGVLRRCGVPPRADQVEEIVQEVYCRLLVSGGRRLRRCRATSDAQVAAFLGRVAERVVLDQLRATRALKRGGDQATTNAVMDERALDPRADPEELLLGRERLRLFLERCGAAAGRRELRRNARILVLAFDGWSSREIAREVGGRLSARGVRGLLRRMRRQGGAEALDRLRLVRSPGRSRPRARRAPMASGDGSAALPSAGAAGAAGAAVAAAAGL